MSKTTRFIIQAQEFIITLPERVVRISGSIFSLLVLLMIVALAWYAAIRAYDTYEGLLDVRSGDVLYAAALLIVFLKAYRILLYYYRRHHISIKYLVELFIIAPAVEMIFASGGHDVWVSVFLGVFSAGNLVILILFYEKLTKIDDKECALDEKEAAV